MDARRTDTRKIVSNAILASGVLANLAFATPVIASQSTSADCVELEKAGLQVPVLKLAAASLGDDLDDRDQDAATRNTQSVTTLPAVPSNSATTDTVAEQTLFDGSVLAEPQAAPAQSAITQQIESTDRLPDIQTRLPGVSSVELQRFKRQMYRRDI